MKPLLNGFILDEPLSNFRLSSVVDIRGKMILIERWIEELVSGKLDSLKEEEVKSRFIIDIFGDILGFNYGNSNNWLLREEAKTKVDGTKPDGALGYFSIDKRNDVVKAVIELKDATIDLESKQKRKDTKSPVDQAFEYAPKMGGSCRWVIVSNFKEIRFYASTDRSRYQVYFLKDLNDENRLKEFLFLFHKDRFIIREGASKTDKLLAEYNANSKRNVFKPKHIIDEIYDCLYRFKGLGFVDPNYLSTLYPFNILDDHVWHYENSTLFTLNDKIFFLLNEIEIQNGEIVLSENLIKEAGEAVVIDHKFKIEWSLKFLNHCMISQISALKDHKEVESKRKGGIGFSKRVLFHFSDDEGITKEIYVSATSSCDCLSCDYRSLDLRNLIKKLKQGIGNDDKDNLEYAFGNFLVATNNFKTTYSIYKKLEKELKGRQGRAVEYFLTKLNIKYLHNFIIDYRLDDSKEIIKDIKSIDLDRVIYDELDFEIDSAVRNYLIEIKEGTLIYKVQDEIDKTLAAITKLKVLYDNGGEQLSGPNLVNHLFHQYFLLYSHVYKNYIIYNSFDRYKALTSKVFKGLVISYQTPKVGLITFEEFFLIEAALHISPTELQSILKDVGYLAVDEASISSIIARFKSLISSCYHVGIFGDPSPDDLINEYLSNTRFKSKLPDIFSNLFAILSRLDIKKEHLDEIMSPLIELLKVEKMFAWYHLKQLVVLIDLKSNLFDEQQFVRLLEIAIDKDDYSKNKYKELIHKLSQSLHANHPDYKIHNKTLVRKAINNSYSKNGINSDFKHLVHFANIIGEFEKELLIHAFEEHLNEEFNPEFYQRLIKYKVYDYRKKDYLKKLINHVNVMRHAENRSEEKNRSPLIFINFALLLYMLDVDLSEDEITLFRDLNSFELWLLNPHKFDYSTFDAKWLMEVNNHHFLKKLKNTQPIRQSIEQELKLNYNAKLAEINYKYFK